jgi:DNA repair exonuclease SbcCD ATPase subunit
VLYSIISKRENLKKELKEIQEKLEDIEDMSEVKEVKEIKEEDIWKINSLEKERIKYSEEAKKIGVEYSKDVLEKTLSELKIKLEYLTKLDKNVDNYNKLLNLETKISSLKTKLTTDITNIEELEKLEKEKTVLISELKKGLELLSCPNCNISLRYQNKALVLGEREPVSLDEIKKCENEYEEIRKNLNNLRQILNYEENISNLDKNIQREDMENFLKNERCKISSLSNIIKKLENIRYVELPRYSSTFLSQVLSYQKLTRRKKEIEETIREKIEEDPDLFKQRLNELEKKYKLEQKRIQKNQKLTEEYQKKENIRLKELSKYEKLKIEMKEKERQNLSKLEKYKKEEEERFKKYKLQIENIEKEKFLVVQEIKKLEERIKENEKTLKECSFDPNIKKKYEKILEDIQEKKNLISEGEYGSKILKIQNELENKRNVVIEKQNDMTTLNRLKLKAVEIECKQLEDTVNNINTVLETTLPIFFPDPISLKLLLYKKIKTGDRIKPGLNLEITYKGMKYDNINSLSGGEGDRISLALLLALNSVSNSSIILLDECVSSLDGNLKENCIEAIKSIPNKTVICIDHDDGMEGFYDSIVEIQN